MIATAEFLADSSAGQFGDVLPWADPYIAQLIDDHAAEQVREDSARGRICLPRSRWQPPRAMAVAS